MVKPSDHQATRILLVEDSLPVRQRIRSMIVESAPSAVISEAGTVADALALFHHHEPDAVVLDLRLPDGSGITVLEAIKRARPACLVIVLTLWGLPECRALCRQLGADHFFEKSSEFDRVAQVFSDMAPPTPEPNNL